MASSCSSFGLMRMWRACTWLTMTCVLPRISLSLTMWKPDGVRIGLVTSPAFMPAMTSREEGGQLRALAPAQRAAFERGLRVRDTRPRGARSLRRRWPSDRPRRRLASASSSCSGVAACGTAMRMCETLYSFDSDGIFFCRSRNWSISRGLTLMRAMTSRWRRICIASSLRRPSR